MVNVRRGAMCVTLLGIGSVLLGCAGQPARLREGLRSPHAWVAEVGPDTAAAALAGSLLWLVALWAAFALSVTAVALAPGRVGLLALAVAERVTPAVLRRVVGAAAGTSILISPAVAFAQPVAGSAPAPIGAPAGPTGPATALGLPMDRPGQPQSGKPTAPPSMPALGWPTDPAGSTDPADPTDPGGPAKPADPASGDRLTPAAPEPVRPRSRGTEDRVLVRPGDSLWSIAAHRLGPGSSAARIQAEWPRWHAANRKLIGANPNLLRPGVELLAPRQASQGAGA